MLSAKEAAELSEQVETPEMKIIERLIKEAVGRGERSVSIYDYLPVATQARLKALGYTVTVFPNSKGFKNEEDTFSVSW